MSLITLSQNVQPSSSEEMLPDIIVFSHLRWEFVKQRPQHLLERLSQNGRILFVEEPIPFTPENYGSANMIEVSDRIVVLQPRIEWQNFKALRQVIKTYSHLQSSNPVAWFYSASFYPVLESLTHSLVVYDCMDELAAFIGAPKELISLERQLLENADVVFTGGKSLYSSKRKHNQNTHCFPSSVDRKHFEKVFKHKTVIPSDIATLAKPVVGFYGVIDERMDLELLAEVARRTPSADFVMIGPVVKIDPATLPQADNIHYLGPKTYDELPKYLKAFKVAMMPFALNDSTKFISPTKTLEFMAAHKPIISTPIYDVVRDYKREVSIVNSAAEFSMAVTAYLNESPSERSKRRALQKAVIDRTSWDTTAEQMYELMVKAYMRRSYRESIDENINTTLSLNVQLAT